LANAQNRVKITKHSLITHKIPCNFCRRDIMCYITCNVSWSPACSMCLVWRQWFMAITNIRKLGIHLVLKFRMGPSSFACYHHQTSNPEVCLCTCWQKKYPKIVFFSLSSPFGSGRGYLPVVLNLNTLTTPSTSLTHACTANC